MHLVYFGFGDVLTIVDKAEESFSESEAIELEKKIRKNTFTLDDYLTQVNKIKKIGSFKQIIGMLPGIPNEIKNAEIDESKFVKIEAIIKSMTKKEKINPKILDASRRKRIAKGSGTQVSDINTFMNGYEQMNKMMKSLASGKNPLANLKF
ncbi:MAG: hypothetical protein RSE41_02195 [Clostridia bacterium]